jgi:hypothetical protein
MSRFLVIAVAFAALVSCKDKNKSEGLPPAQEWTASTGAMPPAPGAAVGANPHAQANPHGQPGPLADDNQGQMPPGHPPIDNPHGGGTDVSKMGLPPPDPNRAINPNNKVAGVIKVHPKAKDRVAAGGAVFIIVKRAVDGAPSGPPLAVDKLEWGKGDLAFEMSEKQAMIAGTELTGDVVVTARYDQDGDALSKQPGDVSGSVRVKIPASKVTLTLDDVLQ